MGAPPIFFLIKILFSPDVSKKLILRIAFQQMKAIGVAKILSSLLGSLTVGASTIVRVPQIKKILQPSLLNQRIAVVNGLSKEGTSLETLSYLVHVCYCFQNKNPFFSYGETFFVGLQNAIILFLIDYYRAREQLKNSVLSEEEQESIALQQSLKRALRVLFIIAIAYKVAPLGLISFLKLLTVPGTIVSKLPQIGQNYKLKSASHLSNITVAANVLGSFIRVFTTLQGFDKLGRDYVLLAGYLSSFILNSTLGAQCYIYSKNKVTK